MAIWPVHRSRNSVAPSGRIVVVRQLLALLATGCGAGTPPAATVGAPPVLAPPPLLAPKRKPRNGRLVPFPPATGPCGRCGRLLAPLLPGVWVGWLALLPVLQGARKHSLWGGVWLPGML